MNDISHSVRYIQELLDAGRPTTAEEALRDLDLEADDAAPLRELLGVALRQQERWPEAAAQIEEASCLKPLSYASQLALAECYLKLKSREAARSILAFLANRDDFAESQRPRLAGCLGAAGEYYLALKVCRASAAADPENDQPLYGMAYYMNKLGYPPETILPVVLRASELAPEQIVYRVAGALLAERSGRPEQAFRLIRDLTCEQLGRLGCARCLERLLALYDAGGDRERPPLIRAILASRQGGSCCRDDRD